MKTALIAGRGGLPRALANAMGRAGTDWFACHLDGFAPDGVGQSRSFRIEHLGSFLADLRAEGVERVVFGGSLARPALDPSAIDAATRPLVPRMVQAIASGDDAALRVVIALFEEAGLHVAGTAEVAPELVRVPTIGTPTDRDRADIDRGRQVLTALGPVDVGQGVVVAAGQILAVEALPGTDWMLASLAAQPPQPPRAAEASLLGDMADWLSGPVAPRTLPSFARPDGGVFVKAPKPGQDRRIDLPTIGPETIRRAVHAGLNGIAVEAGGVIVLDSEDVTAIARDAGLFLYAFEP